MAKLNVVIPSVDVEVDGVKYRKVERDAWVGDIIKYTVSIGPHLSEGFYAVNSVDYCNDPQITDDDGDSYDTAGDDFEVYEKVTSAPVKYREVKRKANVGERIKIVDAGYAGFPPIYKNGETFTVTSVKGYEDVRINRKWGDDPQLDAWVAYREYVVLEPITEPSAPTQPERLKVGEYAKVIDACGDNGAKVGDIILVEYSDHLLGGKTSDGRKLDMLPYRFIRATDAEREEYEAATKPAPKFEVGERVRIIRSQCNWPVGTIVTITRFVGKDSIYATDENSSYLANVTAIEKLSAEDIAKLAEEAEKQREEAKWNAIGRKVGEYKAGDVVEVTVFTGYVPVGSIGVVSDVRSVEFRVNTPEHTGGNFHDAETVKLIAPVESLFNATTEGGERK